MTIAIAGCGPVGTTILETLLERPKHRNQVVVLTRNPRSTPLFNQTIQVQVDYSDISSTTAQLESHAVHTVICAFGMSSPEAFQAQLDLIKASEKSTATKRFIPSEFSFVQDETILHTSPDVQDFIDITDALKKTGLEYTRVYPGYFMDYWGIPNVRTHIKYFAYGVDICNARALIPGDGNDVITMTYSYDMAKFVVHLLDLQWWPESSYIAGDDITFNQLLDLAQRLRGKKFDVTYVNVDKVKQNQVPLLPQPEDLYYSPDIANWLSNYMSQVLVCGSMKLPREGRLNAMFPHIHPVSMSEFLADAWTPN
ncbi:hypothetical protein CNMCM7691_000522 [Aspergillus felis]|uniref:NmrA-like domain-containing protein n=1 Tax=Aspergillus felis TaxID=1287682 RepID=A0A8H6VAQ6_9EURO|nr:hypothetical protein CNMCM7691_000522 [Aspergillus felis]